MLGLEGFAAMTAKSQPPTSDPPNKYLDNDPWAQEVAPSVSVPLNGNRVAAPVVAVPTSSNDPWAQAVAEQAVAEPAPPVSDPLKGISIDVPVVAVPTSSSETRNSLRIKLMSTADTKGASDKLVRRNTGSGIKKLLDQFPYAHLTDS